MRLKKFRRRHGVGNVLMLLPVLQHISRTPRSVILETRPEWVNAFSILMPELLFTGEHLDDALDLDKLTKEALPQMHRIDEFAELLGVKEAISPIVFKIPEEWKKRFRNHANALLFAPEAGHPARSWPPDYITSLAQKLCGSPLVLIGLSRDMKIPCDADLRGQMAIEDTLGLMSVARGLIAFDSGALHLGMAVDLPAIAIFSGVDPRFRIKPSQRVLALQSSMDCSPCNKREPCDGRYDCLRGITPEIVYGKVSSISRITRMSIERI